MAVKIVRILILGPVLVFLVFCGFDALIKRLESKKFDEDVRRRIIRQQKNAYQDSVIAKWAKHETHPKKIAALERQHGKNIEIAAIHHKVNPKLIKAIVLVESSGNAKAVSSKKAIGLMGVKAIAAKDVGADPKYLWDPFYNLLIGAKHLRALEMHYGFTNLEDRLVAYNRGTSGARALLAAGHKPQQDPYVQKIFLALEKIN